MPNSATAPIPIPSRPKPMLLNDTDSSTTAGLSHPVDMSNICTFDREKLFPSHIAAAQGLDPATMAILEIPNGSSTLYNSLLQYAAHMAVDLDQKLPPAPKEETDPKIAREKRKKEELNKLQVDKGHNGVPIPKREAEGFISSLWNCPEDRYDPFGMSDSESETETESGSESEDDSDAERDRDFDAFVSLGALKKKSEPPVQRYQLGLGYAKCSLHGKTILMHHWAYGMPVSESYSIQVFRTLIIAAEDAQLLKELCAVSLKWRSDRELANQRARPGRFTLFRFKTSGGGCGDWSNQGYKRSRPPKSVILPDGQLESIVRDLKDFVARDTKAWYECHGLPHRRSFLFHGPPGCGKTSTIRMIAGMFRLNACFLSLTAADFSNQVLQDALSTIPRRALLVLEDVDVLFNEDRKSETGTALTFSGMLNALDGLVSVDGIITIFTTNHIEKLDPALIRGGRVDRRFEFVHPNMKQMWALFKSFYEDATPELCDRFAHTVLNRPEEEARSIATLQQHFIYTRKKSAEDCVELIPQFFKEFYPGGGKRRNHLYI